MSEGLNAERLEGALEALLFVTDEPVDALTLARAAEAETTEVNEALIALRERLDRAGSGIQLREVAGGWRLYTNPAYHELVQSYVLSWDTRRMSQAALETLAIVAYLQPTTRGAISSVRGVNSDSPLGTLVERGYVREAGTSDAPGNPQLYATTKKFLERFGLGSPRDLPPLEDYAPDEKTARLIAERLGALRGDDAASVEPRSAGDGADVAGTADDGGEGVRTPAASKSGAGAAADDEARQLLDLAASSVFGVVDKIDFSTLSFDTDDE